MSRVVHELRRGVPMRRMGDRLVDPFFATMMERHVPFEHRETLLSFCESGFGWAQLSIVLRLMRVDVDGLMVEDMAGEYWADDRALSVSADLAGWLKWRGRETCLTIPAPSLSETIRMGMLGRRLGELCTHPCVPEDLRIVHVSQSATMWNLTLGAPD